MSATRISVEWMTDVPQNDEGGSDYDRATWAFKTFAGDAIKQARMFARVKAARNPYRQVLIRTEHAPHEKAPEHLWEQDHEALEIVEAA